MQLATEECFDHLRPDSFKPLSAGLEVRETAIAKVTGGAVGVKVFRAVPGAKQRGIPWHWHELGCHVSYVTRGWAVYEFEGIPGSVRIEAGCFIYQPPYNRHRELEQSEDFEAMEFTFPGNFNSVIMQYDEESKDWQYSNVTIG